LLIHQQIIHPRGPGCTVECEMSGVTRVVTRVTPNSAKRSALWRSPAKDSVLMHLHQATTINALHGW
jgi:hypothetical protein